MEFAVLVGLDVVGAVRADAGDDCREDFLDEGLRCHIHKVCGLGGTAAGDAFLVADWEHALADVLDVWEFARFAREGHIVAVFDFGLPVFKKRNVS